MYNLLIHNPNRDALDTRHITPWRDNWKNPLAVYSTLTNLPDSSSINLHRLMVMSHMNASDVPLYVMAWLEAAGFISRDYDEITVLSVPEFRLIPDVSQQFRSVHHIEKKPLPEDAGELWKLRRRFSPGKGVGKSAYEFYLDNYDKDVVDVPMLGIDKHKLRGILCELQASGLVNTFASPHQLIYVPWDTPKENAEDAVANWLKSPDAEPEAHLAPKSTDPKWKRFLDGYKALAKHCIGSSVVFNRKETALAKKLVKEHDEYRLRLYLVAANFFLYYTDFEEAFEWDIKRFGYSFRTFYYHFEAIAADYEHKRQQIYRGNEHWPFIELKQDGFDVVTEFDGW